MKTFIKRNLDQLDEHDLAELYTKINRKMIETRLGLNIDDFGRQIYYTNVFDVRLSLGDNVKRFEFFCKANTINSKDYLRFYQYRESVANGRIKHLSGNEFYTTERVMFVKLLHDYFGKACPNSLNKAFLRDELVSCKLHALNIDISFNETSVIVGDNTNGLSNFMRKLEKYYATKLRLPNTPAGFRWDKAFNNMKEFFSS